MGQKIIDCEITMPGQAGQTLVEAS